MNADTEQKYLACPVCESAVRSWRVKNVGATSYNIDLCRACGFAFVNPRPSFSFLMEYYTSFGHRNSNTAREAVPTLASVLRHEKSYANSTIDAARLVQTVGRLFGDTRGRKFLDVGCGYGFFSRAALDAGFDVSALELAKNEREIATEMTGLDPAACSFEEFQTPTASLSVVLMSQILEHALDVNLWVQKARSFLANDGILAIALPNYGSIFRMVLQANEPYITPPEHLNFFNPASLSHLLERHGFRVEHVQWVSRIPSRSFERRIPAFGKPILPAVTALASAAMKIVDALRLGMIINVYARKMPTR